MTNHLLADVVLLGFNFLLAALVEEGSMLNAPSPPPTPTAPILPPAAPPTLPTLPKLKGAF